MNKSNSEDDFWDDDGYDAVVVGSGYGGSVAAWRMSMAGFKVSLLEKGKKWESQDFPTDSFKLLSAVRMENRNLGINFGPKDALFQLHIQDDSLAATACGLGGGSLINAGVMLPTPVRARRNPKWPKAWEKDWDECMASASNMLKIQNIPNKFQNSKIMEQVIDEEYNDEKIHSPLKVSINFDDSETRSCLACGNCLSGCPYNAKNSTDRTYLASAIQAGCTIKTECEVQCVVKNADYNSREEGRRKRRWLVFLNEVDYVESDFVILAGGVFGTAKILFESQLRGLEVSEKLGSGLSCNGNNVAYLVGSSAPLNASGLSRKQFSKIPFQERPGPSISSSYTSSLGFTIQSAVLPTAYPCFLFKGTITYGWKSRFWLLHDVIDKLKLVICSKQKQAMALNAMGYDESNGKLTFDKKSNEILFQPPNDPLLPRKVETFQKIAKKLGGNLFMSRYRSTSVHLLGGCNASSDISSGVCNPLGQVYDGSSSRNGAHPGLYICDASIIPCSVGINPCLTITAAAEYVSTHLVKDAFDILNKDEKIGSIHKYRTKNGRNLDIVIKETMRGEVSGMPCTACFVLKFGNFSDNSEGNEENYSFLRGKIGGYIICKGLEKDKLYIIHGEVDLCSTDIKTPYTQYMNYYLVLAASSGSRYVLEGKKTMNPYLFGLYMWRESTTLNVTLRKITNNNDTMKFEGKLHISLLEFLKMVCGIKGGQRSKFKFICHFMQSLLRTYVLQVPRRTDHINFAPVELAQGPYPNSTIHEVKTEDDFIIRCQRWEHEEGKRPLYPVLLINGYSTESYYLPTEPKDMVRTLLKQGRDVWLLHARLHPLNSSNDFSIEDIGKLDIPAAIRKMNEFYGESIRVHVVAHCVGGLAVHIAIMGGYVSSKKIASLSCTNSSMFFKLTKSAKVKMWLPLIQISMSILGKNKTLPLLQTSTVNLRHRILKSIARLLPRYERCTCDECEVFSGIFGNTFWHKNISQTMHYWMNKEYLSKLPMAAFPHLRKICNAGFIVDNKGEKAYLIHPERMALPTLYISGGRSLLVSRETTFLANKYMKLHQPGYRHERVVIEGFGHSDLLIGEKSHEMVFPYIIKHIELAEGEMKSAVSSGERKYSKEALAWSVDPYEDDDGIFGSWILLPLIFILLLGMIFRLFFLILCQER